MDIARLGVVLDPKPFTDGESAVLAALKRIEEAVSRSANNVVREEKKQAGAFAAMAAAARETAAGIRNSFDGMANAVGMVSPQLGFAMQAFGMFTRSVGGAMSALRNAYTAAGSFAAGIRNVAIVAGTVTVAVGALTAAVAGLLAIVLPLVVAFKAAHAGFSLLADAVKQSAQFEDYTLRFANLLGSMDKAKQRMTELARLADATPFELDGLVQASITLEALTRGAWSSEKAILAVGNAAARGGMQVQDTADLIGRLYAALQIGVNYDDPLRTLIGKGVLDPRLYPMLMQMVKAGADFKDMWKLVEEQLGRADGAMGTLATTFNGRVSTMSDAWDAFKRTIGEPIRDAAKLVVEDVTGLLQEMTNGAQSVVPVIKEVADTIAAAIHILLQPGGIQAGLDQLAISIRNALDGGFSAGFERFNEWVKKAVGVDMKAEFDKLMKADFWTPMGNALLNIAIAFVNAIRDELQKFLDSHPMLKGSLQLAGKAGGVIGSVASAGIISQPESVRNFTETGEIGRMAYRDIGPVLGTTVSDAAQAEAFANANNLTITGPATIDVKGDLPTTGEGGISPGALALLGDPAAADQPDFVGPPSPFEGMTDWERMMAAERQRQADRRAVEANQTFTPPAETDFGALEAQYAPVKKAETDPEYKKMQSDAQRFIRDSMSPQQEYEEQIKYLQKLRDEGMLTSEQFQAASATAHDKYVKGLEAAARAQKKLADEGNSALERLMADWGNLAKQIDQANVAIAQSIASNLTNALGSIIDGTKSASEAFKDMANAIVKEILRIVIQLMVQYALSAALGMAAPLAMPAINVATVKHDGGMVGDSGPTRAVASSTFSGAPRYHVGGMAGLQPGEVPAILEKGEMVIPKEKVSDMKASAGRPAAEARSERPVTVINVVDPNSVLEAIAANPDAIVNAISRRATTVRTVLKI